MSGNVYRGVKRLLVIICVLGVIGLTLLMGGLALFKLAAHAAGA